MRDARDEWADLTAEEDAGSSRNGPDRGSGGDRSWD
jgi:hypothetical protein